MSKARGGVLALGVAFSLYAAFFAIAASQARYPLAGAVGKHVGIRGAYHVHSVRSHDGHGTPEQIAGAARSAGLDFVVLTDHNVDSLAPAQYVDGVLLVSAEEASTPEGHLVVLGASRALTAEERTNDAIGHAAALGGKGVIAHPIQTKCPWTDWKAARRAAGLELYSADSMFRAALRRPLTLLAPSFFGGLVDSTHGLETLVQPDPPVTQRLLELSDAAPKLALCALDAHGQVGLASYESEFRALSMYLPSWGPHAVSALDPSAQTAATQVLDALTSGEAYCGFHGLAEAGGFRLSRKGNTVQVVLPLDQPPEVKLQAFGGAHVQGLSVVADGTGPFQVEVWARVPHIYFGSEWKPWLVASPFAATPSEVSR